MKNPLTPLLTVACLVWSVGTASAANILVYGPADTSGRYAAAATADGHTVTVATSATWAATTTAGFAAFDAIVIGDSDCTSSKANLAAAEANKATWSAAVTGNIVITGTDEGLHALSNAQAIPLIKNATNFASAGGATGLYVSLGCYYFLAGPNTPVPLLSEFGVFEVEGQVSAGSCNGVTFDDPGHPVLVGLTPGVVGNFGCSLHEMFNSKPGDLDTIASASTGKMLPWIIAGAFNNPPNCTGAAASVAMLWPPDHEFVPISVEGVTDPDGDPITITIDSIFQDEPTDTLGDGEFTPDGQGVGTDNAEVRAERSGSGDGRVYHISFTAEDGQGGECTGEVRVGVPHDKGGANLPVDGGALFDSTL